MTLTSRCVRVLLATSLVVASGTALATPAAATPVAPVQVDAAARARSDALTGYRVALAGAAHRVSTTVRVPTVTCPATGSTFASAAVYLGGHEVGSARDDLAIASVDATCDDGRAEYGVFAATAPTSVGFVVPVAPGDLLTLTVTTSRSSSTASVTDAAGRSLARSTDAGFRADRAQVTVQGGYAGSAVPVHSPVTFTHVRVDGAALSAANPQRLTQVAADGAVVAAATPLSGAGDAFTVRQRR